MRPSAAPGSSRVPGVELRRRGRRARPAAAGRDRRDRARRPHRRRRRGLALVRDYKGRGCTPARAGRRTGGCRSPCTRSPCASCSSSSRSARSISRSVRATCAPRGIVRDDVPGPLRQRRRLDAEAFDAALDEARETATRARRATCGRAGSARARTRARRGRLRLPGHLPRRARQAAGRRCADAPREPDAPFTPEQRAAVASPHGLGAARRQRRLRQDRRDGRAVRGGGAATTASRSAPSSR